MDVLGLPPPATWQGQSLLGAHSSRTFFFAVWSDYLFGFREGNQKFIFNASSNKVEIYDLAADPQEMQNLVGQTPDSVITAGLRSLAAWVQHHDEYIGARLQARP
jgi:hypothetical protein